MTGEPTLGDDNVMPLYLEGKTDGTILFFVLYFIVLISFGDHEISTGISGVVKYFLSFCGRGKYFSSSVMLPILFHCVNSDSFDF